MGDSTAMTIEFLRARLLSERSLSRAAKERADQLAKRVMELEEQLKVVTIQRKKAEKAAAEVLAILEAQGIDDFSELTDSSSDQNEVPSGMKGCEDTFKEDETSTASKMEKSEVEDVLSGSEHEVSPSQVGSISWTGCSSSPDFQKMQKAKQIRQRQRRWCFMSSAGSSPKYHLGKSCRKIKLKEMGSAAKDDPGQQIVDDAHAKAKVTWSYISDDQHDSGNEVENMFPGSSMPFPLINKNEDTDAIGSGRGEEMERVLEQQAQLIGQYQTEEDAQTEWERKYSENKNTTTGYRESGNQLHVTQNSRESKDEDTEHVDEKPYYDGEAKPRAENLPTIAAESLSTVRIVQISHSTHSEKMGGSQEATTAALSDGFVPVTTAPSRSNSHVCRDDFLGQQYDEAAVGEIEGPSGGGTFTNARKKQNQELKYDDPDSGASSNPNLHPPGHEILDVPSSGSPSSAISSNKISKWGSSDLQLSMKPSSNLGVVLEALQHAKVSLRHKLNKSPLTNQGTLVSATPTYANSWANISGDALKVPVGSAGLFRLPTDSSPQSHFGGHEIYGSRLRLAATSPYVRYASNANGYPYQISSHIERRSGVSMNNKSFDPYHLVTGVPASSGFSFSCTNARTGLHADYQNPTERQTLPDRRQITQTDVRIGVPADYQNPTGRQPEIPKPHSDMRIRLPPEDRYLIRGHDITPDMQLL
ncbi:hypothetical protein COCNU_scaffold009328G000010 [Cocos nucifera]|nr:hypothetical protein [Cocos nucifera]